MIYSSQYLRRNFFLRELTPSLISNKSELQKQVWSCNACYSGNKYFMYWPT